MSTATTQHQNRNNLIEHVYTVHDRVSIDAECSVSER